MSLSSPYRAVTCDAQDKILQALQLLQEAALLPFSKSIMMERYEYAVNPNCTDEDETELYDHVEINISMRTNRRNIEGEKK